MTAITEWLQDTLSLSAATQNRIMASLVAILALWAVRRIALWIMRHRVDDVRARYRWQKLTAYTVVPVGILIVGRIWFEGFSSIATFLGLVSAGIAIALKDLLVNLAGWAFILWRRPFEVGDRIQIGGHAGDVIDVRIFQFTLLEIGNWVEADQSTGRVIHVPNGKILTDVLANYSKGFKYLWNELPILVTFESNWQKGKEILQEIALQHAAHLSDDASAKAKESSSRFMIFYSTLTPTVYTSVADCGVLLTMRYLCEPRRRRSSEQEIWEDVLRAFGDCKDIDFAYPTTRFYDNRGEGKPGARAPIPPPGPGSKG